MQMPEILTNNLVQAGLFFVIALACGFMGYRLQKGMIALAVFWAAFILFQRVGGHFLPDGAGATGFAIVAAAIAAALSYHLYLAGIFVALVILAVSICQDYLSDPWLALMVGVVVGCVLGGLAVKMNRPIVILVTGVVGGFAAAKYGTQLLMGLLPLGEISNAALLTIGVIFAVVGTIVQFRTTKDITAQ